MAYVRPARKEEVVAWIYDSDLQDASIEELAEALVAQYDLVGYFSTPS